MAPEIRFSDFLRFVVQDNDPTELITQGEQRLKKMVAGESKSFLEKQQITSALEVTTPKTRPLNMRQTRTHAQLN